MHMQSGPLEQGLGQGCSQELLTNSILACNQNKLPYDSSCEKQARGSAPRVGVVGERPKHFLFP